MKSLDELRSGTPLVSRASDGAPPFEHSNMELRAAGSSVPFSLFLPLHSGVRIVKDATTVTVLLSTASLYCQMVIFVESKNGLG